MVVILMGFIPAGKKGSRKKQNILIELKFGKSTSHKQCQTVTFINITPNFFTCRAILFTAKKKLNSLSYTKHAFATALTR